MSDQLLAMVICGGAALLSVVLLFWAWTLKNAIDDRASEITGLVNEARNVRNDIAAHRRAIENAASIIDRAANPPKPVQKKAAHK